MVRRDADQSDFIPEKTLPELGGTTVNIIGRDFWGCWLAIGNGQWLPADAIDTRETLGHPILIDNSDGCSIANAAVSCPDA